MDGSRYVSRLVVLFHSFSNRDAPVTNNVTNDPWKRISRNFAQIKSVFVAFKLHFNSKCIFDSTRKLMTNQRRKAARHKTDGIDATKPANENGDLRTAIVEVMMNDDAVMQPLIDAISEALVAKLLASTIFMSSLADKLEANGALGCNSSTLMHASGTCARYTTEQWTNVRRYSLRVLNIICHVFNNSNETNRTMAIKVNQNLQNISS